MANLLKLPKFTRFLSSFLLFGFAFSLCLSSFKPILTSAQPVYLLPNEAIYYTPDKATPMEYAAQDLVIIITHPSITQGAICKLGFSFAELPGQITDLPDVTYTDKCSFTIKKEDQKKPGLDLKIRISNPNGENYGTDTGYAMKIGAVLIVKIEGETFENGQEPS